MVHFGEDAQQKIFKLKWGDVVFLSTSQFGNVVREWRHTQYHSFGAKEYFDTDRFQFDRVVASGPQGALWAVRPIQGHGRNAIVGEPENWYDRAFYPVNTVYEVTDPAGYSCYTVYAPDNDNLFIPVQSDAELERRDQELERRVAALLPKHDLLDGVDSEMRKHYPLKTGVIDYFRDALLRIALVSYEGNKKHNGDAPLHWSRGKSGDHDDCIARHLACADDEEHLANLAWRALAALQIYLERKYNIRPPQGIVEAPIEAPPPPEPTEE